MIELSTIGLYQPLAQGTSYLEDVSRLFWPSYRRVTLAMGGDFTASAAFTAADHVLERWLDDYLGCHVLEKYSDVTAFQGLIFGLRLAYNGVVLSRSLENLSNRVAVFYTPGDGQAAAMTAFSEDTTSVNQWGTKELIYRPRRYMSQSQAEQLRSNLLAELKQPKLVKEEVDEWDGRQPGTLQVDIRGYAHTLDWQNLKNTSTATDDADDEVQDALTGADFVTAGTLTTNTMQVSEEVDYIPAWQRIKAIAQDGDNSGNRWLAGCYQGRTLNYWKPTVSAVTYSFDTKAKRPELRHNLYDAAGNHVPAPLVQPGVVVFARDIMPGRPPTSPLLDDPRAIFLEAIEYSAKGIKRKGSDQQAVRLAGLEMAASGYYPPKTDPIFIEEPGGGK